MHDGADNAGPSHGEPLPGWSPQAAHTRAERSVQPPWADDEHHPSRCPAPGQPDDEPRWTCAAKAGVGCSLTPISQIWFTISRGVVNEVYYPCIDRAALRDVGFVVTDGLRFFSDETTDTQQEVALTPPGIPAYRLVNACARGRYRIEKEIVVDPQRNVLLQRVRFTPLDAEADSLRLYVLLHPRLGDQGGGNAAWVDGHCGRPMLLARRRGDALAVACSAPWRARSVGYVGSASDPLADLREHMRLTRCFDSADEGNVALAGEIDLGASDGGGGEFVISIAFDRSTAAAALTATLSLHDGFDRARDRYVDDWARWHAGLLPLSAGQPLGAPIEPAGWSRPDRSRPRVPPQPPAPAAAPDLYRASAMVLRVHRSVHYLGAAVASLTMPWGEARGDRDLGGYHLVWPRDLVESASGLLAAGAFDEARRVIDYLRATQHPDGHWPQAMWLEGTPYECHVQMDETALPLLLIDLAARTSAIGAAECCELWPTVRAAADYLVARGPLTNEERWEDTAGFSPYTVATEVAALLVAADLADERGDSGRARRWRDTADAWNDSIERWTYVTGTELAKRAGVEGYYVRIAPPAGPAAAHADQPEFTAHKLPAAQVVSPDALALVRFGLRDAHYPRILNTVRVIDLMTKVDTPWGPCWRRYNGDEYGEHDDGTPFLGRGDHAGRGRAWPLLTGERGHYELAAGRPHEARRLLRTMTGFASAAGMLSEQIWDAPDLPEHDLYLGRPSGSAMPLAWAHAEYVKLLRSLRDGRVFDCPPQAYGRYAAPGSPRGTETPAPWPA